MLLTDGNRKAAQRLWLRKVRIHREAPPDAGASAPKAATAKPQPAPARAQAVPKLETAAQLARRERGQIRLRQKHLASKIWASVRVASKLLAWWSRARARQSYWHSHYRSPANLPRSTSSWRGAPLSDRERPSRRPLALSTWRKIQSVRLTIRAGKFLALGELGAFSKAESRLSQGAPGGSVGSSALPGRNRPITGPLHTRSDS